MKEGNEKEEEGEEGKGEEEEIVVEVINVVRAGDKRQ